MQRGFKYNLKYIVAGLCLLASAGSSAITLTNSNSAGGNEAAMTAALTGTGVTISNLTIVNPGNCINFRRGVGTFSSGTSGGAGPVLSEPDGVVVSNSDFADVAGAGDALDTSNNSANNTNTLCNGVTSDPDMELLEPGTASGEYAVIEFDVVPDSTTLAIPFQFGSEEFPEYVCTIYTDIVGIFVAGPGITSSTPTFSNAPGTNGGPTSVYENYAKTASGDLSSINWVNTGIVGASGGNPTLCTAPNGSLLNAGYYTDNSNGNPNGGSAAVALTNSNLELDGFTNTLFQPITVTPGAIYHVKIAVADTQDRTYDSAAFIHPLFSTGTFSGFDYGDAPDTYKTLTSSGGPSHGIDNSIFLGTVPDNEITGIPTAGADGDDLDGTDDEDGVASFPVLLSNATTYSVDVNVTNNSGNDARLVGWIDFDGSGTFESGEGTQTIVANGTTGATVSLNWTGLSGLVNGDTYARIRFSSDIGLSIFTTGSAMSDGEVEDYILPISGVTFTKYVSTLDDTCSDTLQSLTTSVGTSVYYCYSVTNPNASPFTITATSDDQGHDLSALEKAGVPYAASETVIKKFTFIAGGAELPTGVTTVNNASVTADIGGSSVVVNDSASVTVTLTPPASGVKRLYFDFAAGATAGDLTRDPTDSILDAISANIDGGTTPTNGGTFVLDQGIPFVAPFTITGSTNATVVLRVRKRRNNNTTLDVELYHVDGTSTTATPIGTVGSTITAARNVWQTLTLTINVPADVNFAIDDFIRVVVRNTTDSGTNRRIQIRTEEGTTKSRLEIESGTVINVDNIEIFAETYNLGAADSKFSSYVPGSSTAFIRATVSDPFGSADITAATITLDDPPGTPPELVIDAVMNLVATTASSKVFEYQRLVVAPEGFWPLSVTAEEGYEEVSPGVHEITHTETGTLIVGTTSIDISKTSEVKSDPINVDKFKAIPLAEVEYSITATNTGYGYVDKDTFVLDDVVPAGTRLYLGPSLDKITWENGTGLTTSGLSFNFNSANINDVADDVEFYHDNGVTLTLLGTVTTDGTGKDTTSPRVNVVRFKPKGEFKGSDGVNHPTAIFKLNVIID